MTEKKHVLSVVSDNHFGVLQRVAGLFSRRGYNIKSITAAETEDAEISRMTIVVYGDDDTLEQIKNQLLKLIDIKEVTVLTQENAVFREHVLIKLQNKKGSRAELVEIAAMFGAKILNVTTKNIILELTSTPETITSFAAFVSPYGIISMVRTGVSALCKE